MKRSLLALALVAATASAPAYAATDTFQLAVDYNASALENAETAEAEYQHIKQQVVQTCTDEHADIGFGADFFIRACTSKMMKKVVAKIDNDALRDLHADHKGR